MTLEGKPRMKDTELNHDVEHAEVLRQAAMLAADTAALDRLFDEDMVWIHASSKPDTKASFIEGIADGRLRCFRLSHSETLVRTYPPVALVTGLVEMEVSVSGEQRTSTNRYSAVWVTRPDGLKLTYWQSTRLQA